MKSINFERLAMNGKAGLLRMQDRIKQKILIHPHDCSIRIHFKLNIINKGSNSSIQRELLLKNEFS